MTASFLIAAASVTALLLAALWADRRYRALARLPVNWRRPGKVTLTAPRRVALAMPPALAAIVLTLALANPDRGLATPTAISLLAAGFLTLQALHLYRIDRDRQTP